MNKENQCRQCPNTVCYESNSAIGKVRVEINPKQHKVREVSQVLIENCPIRLEKEKDDINDRRNY